jgi:hypothetical protein
VAAQGTTNDTPLLRVVDASGQPWFQPRFKPSSPRSRPSSGRCLAAREFRQLVAGDTSITVINFLDKFRNNQKFIDLFILAR